MDFDFDGASSGFLVLVAFVRDPAFARVPFAAAGRPGVVPLPLPLVPVVIGFGLEVEVVFFVVFDDLVLAGRVYRLLAISHRLKEGKNTYDKDS
jgi:hypothetical protein